MRRLAGLLVTLTSCSVLVSLDGLSVSGSDRGLSDGGSEAAAFVDGSSEGGAADGSAGDALADAGPPITLVQHTSVDLGDAPVTSGALAFANPVTAGNLLVVGVKMDPVTAGIHDIRQSPWAVANPRQARRPPSRY